MSANYTLMFDNKIKIRLFRFGFKIKNSIILFKILI